MKWIRIIFLIVSILLALFIFYAIWNCQVSYRYEVLESKKETLSVQFASHYLIVAIETLRYFLYYVIVNIVYLLYSILRKSK